MQLLGLVYFLAAVAIATPCCFPDQMAFDITANVQLSEFNSEGFPTEGFIDKVHARLSVDFKNEKFLLEIDEKDVHIRAALKRPMGIATSFYQKGGKTHCENYLVMANTGDKWKCLLDNVNIFQTDGPNRFAVKDLTFTGGVDTFSSCLPRNATFSQTTSSKGGKRIIHMIVIFDNAEEIVDEAVFEPPECATREVMNSRQGFVDVSDPEEGLKMLGLASGGDSSEESNDSKKKREDSHSDEKKKRESGDDSESNGDDDGNSDGSGVSVVVKKKRESGDDSESDGDDDGNSDGSGANVVEKKKRESNDDSESEVDDDGNSDGSGANVVEKKKRGSSSDSSDDDSNSDAIVVEKKKRESGDDSGSDSSDDDSISDAIVVEKKKRRTVKV